MTPTDEQDGAGFPKEDAENLNSGEKKRIDEEVKATQEQINSLRKTWTTASSKILGLEDYYEDNSFMFDLMFAKSEKELKQIYKQHASMLKDFDLGQAPKQNQLTDDIVRKPLYQDLDGEIIAQLPLFKNLAPEHVQDIITNANAIENSDFRKKMLGPPTNHLQDFSDNILEKWSAKRISKLYEDKKNPKYNNELILFNLLSQSEKTDKIKKVLENVIYTSPKGKQLPGEIINYCFPEDKKPLAQAENLLKPLTDTLLESQRTFNVKNLFRNTESLEIPKHLNNIINNINRDTQSELLEDIAKKIFEDPNAAKIVSQLNLENIEKISGFANDLKKIDTINKALKTKQTNGTIKQSNDPKKSLDSEQIIQLQKNIGEKFSNSLEEISAKLPNKPRDSSNPVIRFVQTRWRRLKNRFINLFRPTIDKVLNDMDANIQRGISQDTFDALLPKVQLPSTKNSLMRMLSLPERNKSNPLSKIKMQQRLEDAAEELKQKQQHNPDPNSETLGATQTIEQTPVPEPPSNLVSPAQQPTVDPSTPAPTSHPESKVTSTEKFSADIDEKLNQLQHVQSTNQGTNITITAEKDEQKAAALANVIEKLATDKPGNTVNLSGFNRETIEQTFTNLADKLDAIKDKNSKEYTQLVESIKNLHYDAQGNDKDEGAKAFNTAKEKLEKKIADQITQKPDNPEGADAPENQPERRRSSRSSPT